MAKSGSYLKWAFLGVIAHLASSLPSESSFVAANVGDNVTLQCFFKGEVRLYWYKQTLGQKPRLIASFYKYDPRSVFYGEFKNDSRFALEYKKDENHLKIADLCISDSATYFCGKSYTFIFEFAEGTVVNVRDSGSTIQVSVHQNSSESVQPGGSMTLKCTVQAGGCDGQHNVYWFRKSEGQDLGLIYTDGSNQCVRGPNTQTCVYNLSVKNLNQSHIGTYYCAVASCGHIVIGNGTRVDIEGNVHALYVMYFWSAASVVATLLSALLLFSVFQVNKREHCPCHDSQGNFLASDIKSGDGLFYIAAKETKTNGLRNGMDNTWSECVYFGAKQ